MPFRRNHFKFTEKVQSRKGIIALALALLLLLGYGLTLYLAYRSYGGLSMYIGSIGIIAILLTIVCLVLSAQSMKEENSFQFIPRLSMFFAVLETLCWVGTLILGVRSA